MKKKFSLGPIFFESVEKDKGRLPSYESLDRAERWVEKGFLGQFHGSDSIGISKWRFATLFIFFVLIFVVLLARSFELQIIEGNSFLGKAENNRYKVKITHAPRGVIYDREGRVLARNIPAFRVAVDPNLVDENRKEELSKKLSKILKVPEPEIRKKLANKSYDSITIKENVDRDIALRLESEQIPPVEIEVSPRREYPYGELISNLLGFSSEVSKEELRSPGSTPHQLGDKVGRAGVEETFENILRGANGYELTKVDAAGKKLGSRITTEPLAGSDITLSIDAELQKRVFKTLKKRLRAAGSKAGSAVVLNPNTGEVLALVSVPSFDNNVFDKGLTQKEYSSLVKNPNKPLLNRAIGAAYPPGSTFKIVTAAAGLESGAITPQTQIVDTGYIKLGDQVFNNWLWLDHRRTEGAINVIRAIARSNDPFFFKLGQKIGEVKIQEMAHKFSLGSITGINLPAETAGLVPTEQWKLDAKGEIWFPGETLNLAIGQGDLLVSPLQLSLVSAVYANGGKLIKPTVLKVDTGEILRENFLSRQTIETVRQGMYENTRGDGNVGWLFRDYKIKTAGKTGAAESGNERPHAWYTAFAPYDPPAGRQVSQMVVTVMGEHAGHGSEVSAPATKEIFEWWFANR